MFSIVSARQSGSAKEELSREGSGNLKGKKADPAVEVVEQARMENESRAEEKRRGNESRRCIERNRDPKKTKERDG
ncbi:hypothetical protein ASPZODRAFT_133147, partial [Penicilliopsis zonata CBS 506.65]